MFRFFGLFGPGATRIEPTDAVSMVKKGRAVLVDVREPAELTAGRAKGAVNIPVSALRAAADPASPTRHAALDPGHPVILYCASGARSGMAGRLLKGLGYEAVFNLGTLARWQAGGGRTES